MPASRLLSSLSTVPQMKVSSAVAGSGGPRAGGAMWIREERASAWGGAGRAALLQSLARRKAGGREGVVE